MTMEDQREVVAFLASPSTHSGDPVDVIETHSAIVFLTGARALKLKRAVRFDYLDFSTVELRRRACEAEVRINQRVAPSIYRGVVPITRETDGSLALEGTGQPVDWVVHMVRFDQDGLFDRLAERGALDLALMRPLASAIAAFHRDAERRPAHGGRAGMAWVIEGNANGMAEQGHGVLDAQACGELTRRSREELDRHAELLERRRQAGLVRQCHGDLHLRNIVLLDGRPTLFDAIEFNDAIACVDVAYDLAFLLMDLWRRRLPRHANAVLNGYLADAGDIEGLPLLPLFLSCRAAVRAKTSATAARLQRDAQRTGELQNLAREYLGMAIALLSPPRPRLVAIGGLSGSGKSTLALELAPLIEPVPGAVVVRSDELRKSLSGIPPLERLDAGGYTPQMNALVYRTIEERADAVLRAGHSVVVDAVYGRAADRGAIEAAAHRAGVLFTGIWLDAPERALIPRIQQRQADASDADANVVRQQLAQDRGPITWDRIDASRTAERVLENARAAAGLRLLHR